MNVQCPTDNECRIDHTQPDDHHEEKRVFYDLRKMPQDFMTSELCVQTMLEIINEIERNRGEQTELDNTYKML